MESFLTTLDKKQDPFEDQVEETTVVQQNTDNLTQIETTIQETQAEAVLEEEKATTETEAVQVKEQIEEEKAENNIHAEEESKSPNVSGLQQDKVVQKTQTQQQSHQKREIYAVIQDDGYLGQFEHDIHNRMIKYKNLLNSYTTNEGSIQNFARSYKKFGLNIDENGDLVYREWAPGAKGLSLFGDFNSWNRESHRCTRDDFGIWTLTIPRDSQGELPIKHESRYKCCIITQDNQWVDRVPAWTKFSRQNQQSLLYEAVFWNPVEKYQFKHPNPPRPASFRIYEAHVGMSSEHGKVSTYREFADNVIPKIKDCGYNCIQLMAIQEHSYYASFGYHVTNFFAVSSRSGTPDDVKYLVDTAHSHGIYVIMDLIHSHASLNVLDGISRFDGTDHQYSHSGHRGRHSQWDSMIFDYSKYEVQRFLLSNIAFFIDEYKFDGYRFDAITSMLYHHHGIGVGFSGNYKEYFGVHIDLDGVLYLMLANELIKEINPDAITVAEDVSGMPTLCRRVEEGGIGFDFRLSMFIPDMWIKILRECKDEEWNMGHIAHSLTNRRWKEKCVAYAESHDQAIVGDKTISMWLFDAAIYTSMSINSPPSVQVDRGMALHKMIRLITMGLGGEAYLNFMGNEFGHPEWIDFPREGNHFSYHYCRRQWSLGDNPNLKYSKLKNFDKAMNSLESQFDWMSSGHQFVTLTHESDKIIVFERGDLLFIFNFHHSNSYEHYRIGTSWGSEHVILLDSDAQAFGGHNRLEPVTRKFFFPIIRTPWQNRSNYIQLYIPNRTALVLCAEENLGKYGLSINGRPKQATVAEITQKTGDLTVA